MRREAVEWLNEQKGIGIARGCDMLGLARSSFYRRGQPALERDQAVVDSLNELVGRHGRWGFWKCYRHMEEHGCPWNHKRVWRVYCAMRLNLPRRTRKRLPVREKQHLLVPAQPNVMWAMDFMQDTLVCGKRFRVLNILDEGVREGLAIVVDSSLPAERVVRELDQLKALRTLPRQIRVDNGPEFIADKVRSWCERHQVHLHYIQPGKPAQNAYIERFNRSFRTEILDAHLFVSLSEVETMAQDWLHIYNHERPHAALGHKTPAAFAKAVLSPSPGRRAGKINDLLLPTTREGDPVPTVPADIPSRHRSGINGCPPADAGPLHLFRSDLDQAVDGSGPK